MKIPTKLHIGGITYRVELESGELRDESDHKLCGEIDYQAALIRVKRDMAPSRIIQTLMHEIVHGIANASCMYPSEEDVDRVASGIIAVLRENPELYELLGTEL